MAWENEIDEIHARRKLAKQQGGKAAVDEHHEKGRLTIRERIDTLLDKNSFDEIGEGAGFAEYDEDGKLKDFQPANFILGFGQIDGRKVIVGGEDFTPVYIEATFETCAQRDVKGLYAKAASGGVKHFTGKDSSFEAPETGDSDWTISTDNQTEEACLDQLLKKVVPLISSPKPNA